MINIYYTVQKELRKLDPNIDIEETTGNKLICVYDIDTQSMVLTSVCEIESTNDKNSKDEIRYWIDNNDEILAEMEYELIEI